MEEIRLSPKLCSRCHRLAISSPPSRSLHWISANRIVAGFNLAFLCWLFGGFSICSFFKRWRGGGDMFIEQRAKHNHMLVINANLLATHLATMSSLLPHCYCISISCVPVCAVPGWSSCIRNSFPFELERLSRWDSTIRGRRVLPLVGLRPLEIGIFHGCTHFRNVV